MERKVLRLKSYDYSQNGAYFITVCTKDRKPILSEIVGDGLRAVPKIVLSHIGECADESIVYIDNNYPGISVQKYVIMLNHLHMLILFESGGHGNPPLQDIIGCLKSYTTKRYNDISETKGITLWQRSFYDHIIRDENEYLKVWEYIDENLAKWQKDDYYC